MATISKTGIEPGKIIKSDHILRVINALSATSSADILVDGVISGSALQGDGKGLTNVTASSFSQDLVQTEPWHVPYFDAVQGVWANSPIHVTASLVNDVEFYYVSINATGTYEAESRAPSSLNVYQSDPDAYTIIDSFGNTDNYLQLNIKNFNTGGFASGDLVITADNGTESDMYVDLGINNSGYAVEGGIGAAGDAYLYSLANEFYIGNAREGATGSLNFFVGGFNVQDRVKMKISSSGDLILSGALEVTGSGHTVYGSIQFFGAVTASNIPVINADPYHIPYLDDTFTLVNSAIHQTASLVDGENWYYIGINTSASHASEAPEALVVRQLNTGSYNVITSYGETDNYLQNMHMNHSAGATASADIVVANDISTETSYYVDLGINSSGYDEASGYVGGPNDAYLYSQANHFHIGNAITGSESNLYFFVNGTDESTNTGIFISASRQVGIQTVTPQYDLDVNGDGNFDNNLTVTGSLFVTGGLSITGDETIDGDIQLTGSLYSSGSIYLTGSSNLYINGTTLSTILLNLHYGAFSDLHTQSGSINVSSSFQYATTDQSNGVSITNNGNGLPTRITVAQSGIYNLQFSAQILQGAGSADVAIWFKKNGTSIPNSATVVTVPSNQKLVAAWNYVDSLNAGEYLEIAYQSTSGNTTYPYIASSGNIPGVPSMIATLTQIA